jgi:hypothetical protein
MNEKEAFLDLFYRMWEALTDAPASVEEVLGMTQEEIDYAFSYVSVLEEEASE